MTKRERKLYCYVNKARGSTSSFLLLCGLCSPLKDISQPEEGGSTTDGGWPIGGSWKLNITFILGHSCSSRLIFPSSFLCCCRCQIILWGFQGTKLPSPNWELRRDWHAATLSSNKMATRPVSRCKRHFPRAWRYRPIPQAQSLLPYRACPNQLTFWYSTMWGTLCPIPVKNDRFLENTALSLKGDVSM